MQWHDLQTTARKRGQLIYAMDQGETPVATQPGPWGRAHSGFCQGCVIRGIALHYGGSDFAYNPKTYEADTPDWETTRDQNIYGVEFQKKQYPDCLILPYNQYGLYINMGFVHEIDGPPDGKVLRYIAYREGCYDITLDSGVTAHAVALQNMGKGGWRFFDANYGEFCARTNEEFEKLFDWYMQETGYKTKYSEWAYVIGIDPPPYVNAGFGSSVKALIKKFGG